MRVLISILILVSSLYSAQAQCTSWQRHLHQFGPTGFHYKDVNTAETQDGSRDLIIASTRFSSSFNTAELFLTRINGTDGTLIWAKTYNNVQASRGFDLTVFTDNAGIEKIAVTGYINDGSTFNKAYIAIMTTADGSLIQDEAYNITANTHSQGLNIIYTEREYNGINTPGFVIAGYTTGNYDPLIAGNTEGFLLRTDINLNPLFTTITSSPTIANNDYDMANEVIETNDGYFVSGSVNEDAGQRQGVLIAKINDQGALVWQNSYIYGNDKDKGIDAYYDSTTNTIYLLTYYSVNHYFGFSAINNSNGAIDPVRSFAYLNSAELNRTGFKIVPSNNPSFPNDLLILGYERDGTIIEPNGTTQQGNSVPFAITVDRFSGTVNRFKRYPVPYKDPTNYNDPFRFWDGQSPLIYHPEIGYPVLTGDCYVMVGNRSYGNARTAIESFTIDSNLSNICSQEDPVINLVSFMMTSEIITTTNTNTSLSAISLVAQINNSENGTCQNGGTLGLIENKIPKINIYPIPASEILKVQNLVTNNTNYHIIDITGKTIQKGTLDNNIIDIQNISSGVYFIKISEENNTTTLQFIKH